MKKILLLATSALLLLAGCAKEEQGLSALLDGEATTVTFTASMDDCTATKAAADGDGAAANVNRCIMEVYYGDELFTRMYSTVTDKKASFTTQLVANRTYTVAFWADHVESTSALETDLYYTTNADQPHGGLKAIALKGTYVGNNDARDAFFHFGEYTIAQGGSSFGGTGSEIYLKRPFAQVNVITTDWDKADKVSNLKPTSVDVTIKNPMTAFNALNGAASTTVSTLTYNAAVFTSPNPVSPASETDKTLSMDYLFAAADKAVIDIDWKAGQGDAASTVSHSFANIPYQRNYRTNIKGALLTTTGQWNVTISPDWDGKIDQTIAAIGSIEAANQALKNGKTNVTISSPTDDSTPIEFPSESDSKDISVLISGASGKTITFKNESGANGPANLFITSDSKDLNVNCPNTHVEVITGNYTDVTANTSATTLVVKKEVTIENLTINGGSAEIHGIVNAITKAAGSTVTYRIETLAALKKLRDLVNLGTWVNGKVYLESDIDLNDEEWTPIKAYKGGQGVNYSIDLDGQNHTISNLKITGSSDFSYIGFFSEATDLTVKDLTFDGADLEWPSSVGVNARGGILVGHVYGVDAENVAVKNATVKAYQKVGSLIGYVEGDTNVPNTVKNCSAEKVSLSNSNTSEQWGIFGGLIGHVSLGQNPITTISGCSVKDITISDYFSGAYVSDRLQEISHLLVASVCQSYEGDETPSISSHSVVLENNTISGTNTVLPTCIYSSEYFGWGGNAEERPAWKGYVYVDGEKWVPDYSFECGGVKYGTLSAAVSAASAGSTVQILKAGTYTLCNIDKNITVKGAVEGVVFNCEGAYDTSIASVPNGATFKDLSFSFGNNSNHGFFHAGKIAFDNCTLNGLLYGYGDLEYTGCTFNQTTEDVYALGVYGSPAVTCTNCHFYGTNKAILMYAESCAYDQTVTVTNCDFHASSSTDLKGAVQMNAYANECTGKYIANITNCTIEGFQKVYGFKHNPRTVNATVTVDGKVVYDGTLNMSLGSADDLVAFAAAVNAGSTFKGKTVYLENDVDLSGITYVTAGSESKHFAGTFDGQNHTISNLTINNDSGDALACTGLFGWLDGATVKDLNVSTSSVTGHHYTAVIAGMMVSEQGTCTVSGCTVTGATISCTHINDDADGDKCGGVVAYCGNPNCLVQNCTITNSTISAGRDAGQVVGAGKEAQVTGCSASDVTVSANGTSTGANIRNEVIGRIL